MRPSIKWRIMHIEEGVGQDGLHPLELSIIILQIVQKLNPIIVIIYCSFKIIASFKTS